MSDRRPGSVQEDLAPGLEVLEAFADVADFVELGPDEAHNDVKRNKANPAISQVKELGEIEAKESNTVFRIQSKPNSNGCK